MNIQYLRLQRTSLMVMRDVTFLLYAFQDASPNDVCGWASAAALLGEAVAALEVDALLAPVEESSNAANTKPACLSAVAACLFLADSLAAAPITVRDFCLSLIATVCSKANFTFFFLDAGPQRRD